jgi:selenocysteine lyase/cysteine desulfurase
VDVDAFRAHFPILGRSVYLNSCSLGALSDRAEARLDEFRARWHEMGASAWYEHWLGRLEVLRERVARVHGADARELALLPSTSAALSVVAEAVPARGRTRVVCTELDFPTLAYQWAVKPEVELVVLRSPDGVRIDPEQFEAAVDERTLFLATSHVFFATGWIQDLSALADIARRAGAWSLIDGYQAVGQIPVDVRTAGVDVYTSGPLKWLCGGPGLAYLYVRGDRIAEARPRITSWFATERQFDFDPEGFAYRDDARRFELGTPALPTAHTALGAQELLEEVGWDALFLRIRSLADRLVAKAREAGLGLRVAGDPARRSAIVMIARPDPAATVARLARAGIVVDHRPGHVRVSPHAYNTEDEVDLVVEELARE